MTEEVKLEVGHRVKVMIVAPEERDDNMAMRDGAVVLELRDDWNHIVKCDQYLGTSNDGTNQQSEVRPLNHFKGWKLEE